MSNLLANNFDSAGTGRQGLPPRSEPHRCQRELREVPSTRRLPENADFSLQGVFKSVFPAELVCAPRCSSCPHARRAVRRRGVASAACSSASR